MNILIPVLAVTIIGIICAVGLSVASHVMAVKEDERFPAVRECLPGANCGACGFSGCDGYAHAILEQGAKPNLCVPGGAQAAAALGNVLGISVDEVKKKIAIVNCSGSCDNTQKKADYKGIQTCAAAKALYGGPGSCTFGCIGLGDCSRVCPSDAISIQCGIAHVNVFKCGGCGLCANTCPQHIISVRNADKPIVVRCSNTWRGAMTRKACLKGCIGCRKCEKNCPNGAIKVENNLSRIDLDKCTGCGKCREVCTTGCITNLFPL